MSSNSFDEKTIHKLKAYVYALFDPLEDRPFYIGKGRGNRVFQHVEGAILEDKESNKYEKIRDIRARTQNNRVKHTVIRHGMSDEVAFEVESALIDLANRIVQLIKGIPPNFFIFLFGILLEPLRAGITIKQLFKFDVHSCLK